MQNEKKKIYYWCPFIGKVATVDAVINSILSLKKYSNGNLEPLLINVVGEWDSKINYLNKKNIKVINLRSTNIINYLPKLGFFKSRFTYFVIFFLSIFKLNRTLKNDRPDYLIIHLITFIPLILMLFNNYRTKFILRISGYPKLNYLRKLFWKTANNKIHLVTTPTKSTLNTLIDSNIFTSDKLIYLPDPILKISEIQKKKKENNIVEEELSKNNSLISIGRLTKQKNFSFLIDAFYEIQKKYDKLNLFILGEGEERKNLEKKIRDLNLYKKIFLVGHKKNIYDYLKNSKIFVMSSLWEDPGFVLLEAGYLNKIIFSSDCPNGPLEILDNGKNGFLYKSSSINDFIENFEKLIIYDDFNLQQKKIRLKKKCKEFTLLSHFQKLKKIL
tara:strand:- start:3080 stop:4240 length:1161 start_codon:yes stop_codon:yes gene_type:complete